MNNGWVVGGWKDVEMGGWLAGIIYHTSDGGNTWVQQNGISNRYLASLHFTDANNGWAVGAGGAILHTTNGGLTFVEPSKSSEVRSQCLLMQNYPNPFNPKTMITYQLAMSNWATLRVFDVLGREVATLVNEVKQPGTYTVQFDGRSLASGVYFYRLQAGSAIDAKKFVLVK